MIWRRSSACSRTSPPCPARRASSAPTGRACCRCAAAFTVCTMPRSSSCRSPSGADYTGIIDENGRTRTGASEFLRLFSIFPKLSCYLAGYCAIVTSLRSSQSSRFLNTTINENAGTARSAGGYQPDVPHQFREFRSSMLSSGRQTASILIRLVLPDLPFVMPPVITTLSPGCRCIVSRAARSA